MPYCTNCGNRLSAGETSCASCGKPVPAYTEEEYSAPVAYAQEPVQEPAQERAPENVYFRIFRRTSAGTGGVEAYVYIDGQAVARLSDGEGMNIPLSEGGHVLKVYTVNGKSAEKLILSPSDVEMDFTVSPIDYHVEFIDPYAAGHTGGAGMPPPGFSGQVGAYSRENEHSGMKNKWVSWFLCLLLGYFGVHKFYEGKIVMGLVYLFTFGFLGIGWLADLIVLLSKPRWYYPKKK